MDIFIDKNLDKEFERLALESMTSKVCVLNDALNFYINLQRLVSAGQHPSLTMSYENGESVDLSDWLLKKQASNLIEFANESARRKLKKSSHNSSAS